MPSIIQQYFFFLLFRFALSNGLFIHISAPNWCWAAYLKLLKVNKWQDTWSYCSKCTNIKINKKGDLQSFRVQANRPSSYLNSNNNSSSGNFCSAACIMLHRADGMRHTWRQTGTQQLELPPYVNWFDPRHVPMPPFRLFLINDQPLCWA